jgi:hypothetical protein
LLGVKLRALIADQGGRPVAADPVPFPNGAAVVDDGAAWVLIDGPAHAALGPALAWALRYEAGSLDLVAEADTGLLARRAERFDLPIRVWFSSDRALLPALAESLPRPGVASREHLGFAALIEGSGAELSVEHGVVSGEVRGLEVCRVVDQPTSGHLVDAVEAGLVHGPQAGGLQLEVGVGAADREAFQLIHGAVPTAEALADVVRSVTAHRSDDAPQHPLNRLARERILRWQAVRDPAIVGLDSAHLVDPPVARRNLRDPVPCVAAGIDGDGRPVTVVFSSGVDLDLIPFVADVSARADGPFDQVRLDRVQLDESPGGRLVVALPARDLVPATKRLAALLDRPVEFIPLG